MYNINEQYVYSDTFIESDMNEVWKAELDERVRVCRKCRNTTFNLHSVSLQIYALSPFFLEV